MACLLCFRRSNVLLGREVDPQRYQAALAACGLDHDIAHMAAGDLTRCGSRGSALSGGQCARIALARALCQVTSDTRSAAELAVGSPPRV